MKNQLVLLPLLISLSLAAGCTVVKVSEAGKNVNLVDANSVSSCQRVGMVSTSVLDNVLFIPRNEGKVQSDLDKLARDEAVLMSANTLVHVSTVEGRGNYIAYNCP